MSRAKELIEKLSEKNLTIGAVESFTGGSFAKALTDVSGASKVFKGSLVTYSREVKENLLGIPSEFISKHGVVSYEVCQQMALKGARLLGTDVTVAFTGNAGPSVCEEGSEVGEVYMAILYKGQIWPIPLKLQMERNKLKEYAVEAVLGAILSII